MGAPPDDGPPKPPDRGKGWQGPRDARGPGSRGPGARGGGRGTGGGAQRAPGGGGRSTGRGGRPTGSAWRPGYGAQESRPSGPPPREGGQGPPRHAHRPGPEVRDDERPWQGPVPRGGDYRPGGAREAGLKPCRQGPSRAGDRPPGPRDQRDRARPGRPAGGRASGPPGVWRPQPAVTAQPGLDEGEEVVAGRRPVEEAFAARRPARRLLVVPERRSALDQLVLHATTLRIPVVEVEGGSLTALCGFDGHQGVALVVEERRWATLDDVLAAARAAGEPAFILVLDHLEDPQNVGTLLRSAEAVGCHGVLFPARRAAPLTPAAIKASAGAVEHLRMVPMDDLAAGVADLHAHGIRVVGADEKASLTVRQADLRGPLAIVVGSEGHGLEARLRRRVDLLARIPLRGRVASLNAAVAGSVLLFEAAAQREEADERAASTREQVDPLEGSAVTEPAQPAQPAAGAATRGAGEPGDPHATTHGEGEAFETPAAGAWDLPEVGADDADALLPEGPDPGRSSTP